MPQLALRSFQQTVQDTAAGAQASSTIPLDFTTGGLLRALVESCASIALWLQYVALQVLAATRLATSTGADVDSFVGDYALTRLPAVAATGMVTFSRYSSAAAATIFPGVQVKTTDGTQVFTVTTDTSNALWAAGAAAYVVPNGTASASVPVVAAIAGTGGNVAVGAISLLASSIGGIDTVTNAIAFTNGALAETDAALRSRFKLYLASLSKATKGAVGAAVLSVQQGLSYVLVENAIGTGSFTVTIDDGSGAPSTALKTAVYSAVDLVRPVGTIFSVQGPTVVTASVAITLTLPSTVARPPVVASVATAVTAYIASLGVGQTLYFGRLYQIIYDAVPGVITGASVTINAAVADLTSGATGVIRASSITVA